MNNPYADHFRVIVAGSRDFDDYGYLCDRLDALLGKKERVLVLCGRDDLYDKMVAQYCYDREYGAQFYPLDWTGDEHHKIMAENADALVDFWDGKSRGTKHMIDIANRMGLQVRVDGGWK